MGSRHNHNILYKGCISLFEISVITIVIMTNILIIRGMRVQENHRNLTFTCRGCGLQTIPDFENDQTIMIDLADNYLYSLPENAFSNVRDLEKLILRRNNISMIDVEAFRKLRRLAYLDLSLNKLSSINDTIFRPLSRLLSINLQGNRFHNMGHLTKELSNLPQLQHMLLDSFPSVDFSNSFQNFTNLRTLNIYTFNVTKTKLNKIQSAPFQASKIVTININAKLERLYGDEFFPFQYMRSLHVNSRNTLSTQQILKSIRFCKRLETVTIRNTLEAWHVHSYSSLACIKNLSLSQNSLRSVSLTLRRLWPHRNCVEVLDLSRNRLDPFLFLKRMATTFKNVTYLDLSQQYIARESYVTKRVFPIKLPPSLVFLNISHNPLASEHDIRFYHSSAFKSFDISYSTNLSVTLDKRYQHMWLETTTGKVIKWHVTMDHQNAKCGQCLLECQVLSFHSIEFYRLVIVSAVVIEGIVTVTITVVFGINFQIITIVEVTETESNFVNGFIRKVVFEQILEKLSYTELEITTRTGFTKLLSLRNPHSKQERTKRRRPKRNRGQEFEILTNISKYQQDKYDEYSWEALEYALNSSSPVYLSNGYKLKLSIHGDKLTVWRLKIGIMEGIYLFFRGKLICQETIGPTCTLFEISKHLRGHIIHMDPDTNYNCYIAYDDEKNDMEYIRNKFSKYDNPPSRIIQKVVDQFVSKHYPELHGTVVLTRKVTNGILEQNCTPIVYSHAVSNSFTKSHLGLNIMFKNPHLVNTEGYVARNGDSSHVENETLALLNSVIKIKRDELFETHSNLNIVSVSPHISTSGGNDLEEKPCIVLYCTSKGYIPDGEPWFPTKLIFEDTEVPVDVREGYFEFGHYPTWQSSAYHEKVKMGCKFGTHNLGMTGTIGPFLDIGNDTYFLTCAHVVHGVDENGYDKNGTNEAVTQPPSNPFLPNQQDDIECGRVARTIFSPRSPQSIDAALIKILPSRCPTHGQFAVDEPKTLNKAGFDILPTYDNGTIKVSHREIDTDKRIVKFGATTHCTRGVLTSTGTSVKYIDHDMGLPGTAKVLMNDQLEIHSLHAHSQFFQLGDSGSGVFVVEKDANNQQHLTCIGLAIGVTTYGTTVVTPIAYILDAFGLPHQLKDFMRQPADKTSCKTS